MAFEQVVQRRNGRLSGTPQQRPGLQLAKHERHSPTVGGREQVRGKGLDTTSLLKQYAGENGEECEGRWERRGAGPREQQFRYCRTPSLGQTAARRQGRGRWRSSTAAAAGGCLEGTHWIARHLKGRRHEAAEAVTSRLHGRFPFIKLRLVFRNKG